MDQADIERAIGRLEGAGESFKTAVPSILDAIEASRAQRADWEKTHGEEDRGQFRNVHDGISNLTQGVTRLENLRETVEGHGRALVNFEKRLVDVEGKAAVADAKADTARQVNARWSRGLLSGAAAVGAVAGTAGTTVGPKIWKTVMEFLRSL